MRKEFEKSVRNKGGHSFVHGWLQFAVQERERERPFSINFWPAAEFDARAPIVNRTFFRRTFEGNIVSVKMQHSICPSFSTIFYFSRTFFSFFFFFFRAVTIHKSTNSRLKSLEKCVFQTALECRLDAFGTSARGSRGGIIL